MSIYGKQIYDGNPLVVKKVNLATGTRMDTWVNGSNS